MAQPQPNLDEFQRRVICDQCGARGWLPPGDTRRCADCGGPFRPMAFFEGLVDRLFAPAEHGVSEFYPRHLKLVELMWTAHGRGRDTYEALGLEKVSYSQFVTRATQIVVRGLREGWIEARLPAAPTPDDDAYALTFRDPDRWADELLAEFQSRTADAWRDQVRVDVEGDPDLA